MQERYHDDERPDSAMGPSSEPGDAHPPRAKDSTGLGGLGTEGGPGEQPEGTEPQIPIDIEGTDENEVTAEELREAIERLPGPPSGQRGDLGDSPPGED